MIQCFSKKKKKYNTQVQKYRTKILQIRIYTVIPKLNIYY